MDNGAVFDMCSGGIRLNEIKYDVSASAKKLERIFFQIQ